jgi:hypothetical protein
MIKLPDRKSAADPGHAGYPQQPPRADNALAHDAHNCKRLRRHTRFGSFRFLEIRITESNSHQPSARSNGGGDILYHKITHSLLYSCILVSLLTGLFYKNYFLKLPLSFNLYCSCAQFCAEDGYSTKNSREAAEWDAKQIPLSSLRLGRVWYHEAKAHFLSVQWVYINMAKATESSPVAFIVAYGALDSR